MTALDASALDSTVRSPRLLEQVRRLLRARHMSPKTVKSYLGWIRRYILFHGKRHPAELAESEVNAFLTHLAVERRVSASTQTQALCALLFLYRHALGIELGELENLVRARRSTRLPLVLAPDEVKRVLSRLDGTCRLFATLLYGTGMRLMEGLRLRVKDVDFPYNQITVRQGKGDKDRRTVLPESLAAALEEHLRRVRAIHQRDLADGFGDVPLPHALARKYPGRHGSGGGSTSSRPPAAGATPRPGGRAAITSPSDRCSAPSRRRRARPASPSR